MPGGLHRGSTPEHPLDRISPRRKELRIMAVDAQPTEQQTPVVSEVGAPAESASVHGGYARTVVEFMVLLMIAVQLFRGWVMEAYRVPSGSMALTLAGEHVDLVCRKCGYAFHCGDTPERPIGQIFCPNCDASDFGQQNLFTISGDRLLVFKGAYYLRSPRRWEVIVFRNPHHASQAFIKRVAGLPGEAIEIKKGEVYINGELVRKDLDLQRVLAVPVYNADFEPKDIPSRWQPERRVETQWRSAGGIFRFEPDGKTADLDWLSYRHLRRTPGNATEVEELLITDQLGYNTQFRRVEEVSVVTDLLLRCDLSVAGTGTLSVRMTDGLDDFELRLRPAAGSAELFCDGQSVRKSSLDFAPFVSPQQLEMSMVDKQIHVAVAGELVFEPYPFQSTINPRAPVVTRPVAIGAAGVTAELRHVDLSRDIYYTDPRKAYGNGPATPHTWGVGEPFVLHENEYFVLGDNSAFSDDSRLWAASPVVHRRMLIGKPLVVHLPYRVSDTIPGFQVPDFGRIRYIR